MLSEVNPELLPRLEKFDVKDAATCFNCGNCTAVCSLSSESVPFPRKSITVDIALELIPAVEHFSHTDSARTYLSGQFTVKTVDGIYHCHCCFACFDTDRGDAEKETAMRLANTRLALIYSEFKDSGILYWPKYYS